MKITRIDVYAVRFSLRTQFRLSGGRVFDGMDSTFVALHTDAGLTGWGEACPWSPTYCPEFSGGVRAGMEVLAPALLGLDPVQVDVLTHAMDKSLMGHWYAKAAVDLACWDLAGKVAERPVCDLLGGRFDAEMKINRGVITDTLSAMQESIELLRTEGCSTFSCKMQGYDIDSDIESINALLADRRHGERYVADYNGGMTVADAIRFSQGVESPHLMIEQPCRSYDECRQASERMSHPVRLDEVIMTPADAAKAISDGCAQGIVVKIGRVGGLTKSRHIRDICSRTGTPIAVQDSGGSDVASASVMSLARATPAHILHSVVDLRYFADRVIFDGVPDSVDCRMEASDEPGLGVTPRMNELGDPIASYA